jgi:polar amino acid transport system substrate-binding protein
MSIRDQIAPSGTLRVAINLGNGVLANFDDKNNQPGGITVEIAKKLAAELELPLKMKTYKSAGNVVKAVENNEWDLAFLARDPKRAQIIDFTAPYIIIEGSYLVKNVSPFQTNKDVDQKGVRIAVGKGAAYDLFLSRTLTKATLERAATTPGAVDLFLDKNLEVAAGIKQPLQEFAASRNDVRVLPGRFMVIEQAMALPCGRKRALDFLQARVRKLIEEGDVSQLIRQFNKNQASVPDIAT